MQTPLARVLPGRLFVPACLLLQAGPLVAWQARKPSAPPAAAGIPWWDATFEEARKRAAERNCPIAVVLVQDGEEANGRFVRGVLTSSELRAALRFVVPVLCNLGTGHETRVEDARTVCAMHGAIPCGRHQELARETFEYVSEKGAIATPQIALLAPSGKVLGRVTDVPSTAEFVKAIDAAAAQTGPGVSEPDLAAIDALLREARLGPALQRPAALLGRLGKVPAPPPGGPLAERIAAARKDLLAEIVARVARAQADLAGGKVHEAVREVSFLLEDAAPQPSAAAARALLTESQKRPEGKAARERVELELRAHRAIERAEDLARKGKKDLALREAQSAVRAAEGTPSAEEMRRRADLLRSERRDTR